MLTWIFKWSHSIVRIIYGRHRDDVDVTQTFSYTWADQHFTIPAWSDVTFEVKWWWSNNSAWWISTWKKHFDEETELSIMVWWNWWRTNNWTTYWFGWSTTYGWRWWGWLSWVFTWSGAIWDNDSARALIIAWWAWGGRTWAWAWWGTNWQNWNGGSYWWAWGWASQTAKWSWNQAWWQFHWWGWSWTYWFGWGWWRYWWGWSWWDWSWDDDAQAWWGSWYIWRVENWTTTVWWWSAAWTDWTAKIQYTKQWLFPTEYVEWYLGSDKIRPNHWLPPEYKQIQYIESDWNAYINTLVIANDVGRIDIQLSDIFQGSSYADSYSYVVFGTTWNSRWFSSTYYTNSGARFRYHLWNWTRQYYDCNATQTGVINTIIYEAGTFNVNGASWTYIWTDSSWGDTGANQVCFWYCWNNSRSKYKMYYSKIYDKNNNLLRNLVPCYRKADNVIWLYDLVTNTFFTNAWSWSFTAWPDIGISLDRNRIWLPTAWDTCQLVVTAIPEEIWDVWYTWTSSDPDVATVSSTWLVTCITPGECTIVCTTNDWKYQATCSVIPSIPDYDFYYDFRWWSLAWFQAAWWTWIWTDWSYTIDSWWLWQTGGSNDRNTHAYITWVNFEWATFASIERLWYWYSGSWSNWKGMWAWTSYNWGNWFNGPWVWWRINLNTSSPGTYSTNWLNYYSPDGEVTDYANYASNWWETTERLEIDFINNTAKYILTWANSRTFQIALTVAQKELLRSMTWVWWNWWRWYSSYNSERIRRVKIHIEY